MSNNKNAPTHRVPCRSLKGGLPAPHCPPTRPAREGKTPNIYFFSR